MSCEGLKARELNISTNTHAKPTTGLWTQAKAFALNPGLRARCRGRVPESWIIGPGPGLSNLDYGPEARAQALNPGIWALNPRHFGPLRQDILNILMNLKNMIETYL